MQIQNGAVVTYTGQWQSTYTLGAQDVLSNVVARLSADGLPVRNFSTDAGWTQSTVGGFTIQPGVFGVTLTLQVENGLGFGSENDIIAIVQHEVYAATGLFPIADSIPNVANPNSPVTVTGQPSANTQPSSAGSGSFLSVLKNLGNNTELVLVGMGVVAVAAIVLIGSGKAHASA